MAEDPFDDFLRKVSAERRPLTQQEEREAMIAAWELRDLVKKKIPGEKAMVILERVEQKEKEAQIILERLKPEDDRLSWAPQDSDVSIVVPWKVIDSNGRIINHSLDLYFISSSAAAKETTIFPQDSKGLKKTASIKKDSLERVNEEIQRSQFFEEHTTKEVYFPDKSDLQVLSKLISSANVTIQTIS